MNLAPWLERLTKEYGADIILRGNEESHSRSVFREIDRFARKARYGGRDFRAARPRDFTVTKGVPNDMRLFHETLEFYRKQDWDMAEVRLLRRKTTAPRAHLYDLFLERIAVPRGYPPGPDWDGAFTFQTK